MTKYKVNCPFCEKRILDKADDAKGIVEIKCQHCKKIIKIKLDLTMDDSSELLLSI